jgi:adenylate kinase family enzyme
MKKERPKRIAIIGLPGGGKSTFASKLGKILNIPELPERAKLIPRIILRGI